MEEMGGFERNVVDVQTTMHDFSDSMFSTFLD